MANTAKQVGLGATTTAPPTTKPVVTTAPPTTKPPETTTTTVAKITAFEMTINGDKSGKSQFEPQQASVFVGTPVQFTNTDSATRSVKSGQGSPIQFQSPDIPPGGTWTYTPRAAGTIPIVDGTRPYATGSIYVSAR